MHNPSTIKLCLAVKRSGHQNRWHTICRNNVSNERQAGKDQRDKDSAIAKQEISYYIEKGNNIESAVEMNDPFQTATTLCGFNSIRLEIQEKKHMIVT